MKPKVSIITVYYNRSYCVDQSIESLLNQTFKDFELLLVDDGSSDNTVEKFNSYTDPRVRVITHANMGFTNTIRKAVDLAQGEYIAIHGSGDISSPERIQEQSKFLDENPDYVVVASRFERYDEDTLAKIEESEFSGDLDIEDFLLNCRIMHGASMFRKSTYEQVGGYEKIFTNTQDWDLFLRFLRIGKGKILHTLHYKQFKRGDGVAAKPESFEKNSRISVLRMLLSRKHEQREQILERVNREGIESVILNSNYDFQRTVVTNFIILVRSGYYKKFLHFVKNNYNPKELNLKLKLRFYSWLTLANILHFFKLSEKEAQSFIISIRSLKSKLNFYKLK
ncbi:glycosyltransferase [Algoriphagus sp. AGSA1]|uniref:glycosyltransferase family 2 protein n=1 Tax=Algoriphagus sp. AGSA1 TaxID=2907213 RepID=UPI001F32A67B|nr:glycosyltransferase [Algoriphagus sp. AGSA1]MCE7053707.1 glycosyltransferase [Algoriphagus sp. AGSA1]